MWAFATPAKMPKEYHEVQEASDEVHVEDEDEDSDWGEEDAMLECRDCSSKFMFSKGEQIFYRQRGTACLFCHCGDVRIAGERAELG